jgi:hypothetical protein
VNPLCEGRLRQRRDVLALVIRWWLGSGVEDHGVSEAFELGDEPFGVGFVVAAGVPVGSEVVVGLVAFQHPVGRHQDGAGDRDLGSAIPRRFVNRACWAAR